MTDDMMNLRSLVEKSADADLLREMIGFAAEKLMALEVALRRVLAMARRLRFVLPSAMAIATAIGKRGQAPLSCAFPSCGPAVISQASWSRVAWRKKL